MFKELSPLLRKGDSLAITVSRESDTNLRLTVIPKLFTLDGESGPDRKVLNTPLTITGTVEELDSPGFAATLTRFTTSARLSCVKSCSEHPPACDSVRLQP